jgi:hypothetical protein
VRRLVRGVALALLVGVLITVAVAWTCTLLVEAQDGVLRSEELPDGRWLPYFCMTGFGTEIVVPSLKPYAPEDVNVSTESVQLVESGAWAGIVISSARARRPGWTRLAWNDRLTGPASR